MSWKHCLQRVARRILLVSSKVELSTWCRRMKELAWTRRKMTQLLSPSEIMASGTPTAIGTGCNRTREY